jgi:hypothetical protein
MKQLPVWEEREHPTSRLIDVHEAERDYALLPPEDADANSDYLAWINEFKEGLHQQFRQIDGATRERLQSRGINLDEIREAVGAVTGQPVYPRHRIVTSHDAQAIPLYRDAIEDGFFDRAMRFRDGSPSYGEFEYIMHFIRLRAGYANRAPKVDVIDTCAHALGHASLAKSTYMHLDRLPEGNKVYHWFGYTWRYNDAYYGELLDSASAAKIAAETRQRLGAATPGPAAQHPLVEPYREGRGYSFATVGALALDVINQAAGHRDPLGVYRPLWAFIANNQDPAAREELASMVRRATGGTISLEEIEAQEFSPRGMPRTTLQRIEEVCGLDASQRPSQIVHTGSIY